MKYLKNTNDYPRGQRRVRGNTAHEDVPPRENGDRYLERARVFQAVAALAKQVGLRGDLFAPSLPECGTLEEEHRILCLLGQLPLTIRRHPLAIRMLRAAVLAEEVGS